MKVACSTTIGYKRDLDSVLHTIHQLGFTGVDLLAIDGWAHVHPIELAAESEAWHSRLDGMFKRFRLAPAALNIGTRSQLHDRTPEAVAERDREIRAAIRLMKRFSIPVAVIQPRGKDPSRPDRDVMLDCVATLKEILPAATSAGVKFALELHVDSPFETLDQARELISLIPDINLVYDPSHLVMQGVDVRETEWLLDRCIHVHLRDAAPGKMQVRLGEGNVDLERVLSELKRRRYGGCISIEYLESDEYDVAGDVLRLESMIREHFPHN